MTRLGIEPHSFVLMASTPLSYQPVVLMANFHHIIRQQYPKHFMTQKLIYLLCRRAKKKWSRRKHYKTIYYSL